MNGGVTFQQVQKYENGKNRVGASRLQMISTALNVPVGHLFADGAGTSRTSEKPLAFDGEKIASYLIWPALQALGS